MNREDRRAAARQARRRDPSDPFPCGCYTRWLTPLDPDTSCPGCGRPGVVDSDGLEFPTQAAAGATLGVEVGCCCGAVWSVPCRVGAW